VPGLTTAVVGVLCSCNTAISTFTAKIPSCNVSMAGFAVAVNLVLTGVQLALVPAFAYLSKLIFPAAVAGHCDPTLLSQSITSIGIVETAAQCLSCIISSCVVWLLLLPGVYFALAALVFGLSSGKGRRGLKHNLDT